MGVNGDCPQVMDQDAIICQICREPVWNFLCIDCISKDVGKWLPKPATHQFSKFHNEVKSHFHTLVADNYEPCLNCEMLNESPICPYCYTHEVYHWLAQTSPDLAKSFGKIFFFYPFEGSEHIKSDRGPIEATKNAVSMVGVCDGCGEYSETLVQAATEPGGVYCETCRDE